MKVSILIVGILAIIGVVFATPLENDLTDSRLTGIIDGMINTTINKILANLSDPIAFDQLPLNLTSDVLKGNVDVADFQLYGLKKLVATKLDVSILGLNLNATILLQHVLLNTKYDADVTILELIPFYGNGRCSLTLDDIEIFISGKLNLNGGLSLSNVTVSFGIGDSEIQLTGILKNEDLSVLITTLINDTLLNFVNDHKDAISKIISPIAESLINSILKGGSKSAELLELQELYEAEVAKLTM